MTRYAAKTEVPVEKTRAEIEATVRRYGADSFLSGWEGDSAMLQFRCAGRFVKFVMILPSREEDRFCVYLLGSVRYRRKSEQAAKLWEQACRQKWRALALMIKAKLEAVESGIVTFEEEFLAHVLMPDGRSLYEHAKAPLAHAYDTGGSQALLPGGEA